jgi:hypothetical protein
MAKTDCEGC